MSFLHQNYERIYFFLLSVYKAHLNDISIKLVHADGTHTFLIKLPTLALNLVLCMRITLDYIPCNVRVNPDCQFI